MAVLLGRPSEPRIETINDADCYLANFWRGVAWPDPVQGPARREAVYEEVVRWTDWPVNEADLHARHRWLVNRTGFRERMMREPDYYDPRIAGWWVWGLCAWIGSGWCGLQAPARQKPHLTSFGQGIHARGARARILETFSALAGRLRHVRVVCGDYTRVLTKNVIATTTQGRTAIFLDPPYADTAGRCKDLYGQDSLEVAHRVRDWAVAHGEDERLRICLAGYEGEHRMPTSWARVAWKAKGGYGLQRRDGSNDNAGRERLWFSPGCLVPESR